MKKLITVAGLTLCLGMTACARDGRYDYRYDGATYNNSGYDSTYDNRYMSSSVNDQRYDDDTMAPGWRNGRMERKARMWFNKADMNGDGYVTRAESRAFGDQMFRQADTNRDGRVSFDECLAQKHREWTEMRDSRGNW